jgi:uncharacterized protein (TIGR00661 family)
LGKNINIRVLVAPLDWGLGHATRCVPIIQAFLDAGCTVLIAAKGNTALLLQTEFPALELLELEGYGISYSANKKRFAWKIATQIPQIINSIRSEKKWIAQTIVQKKIDLVISDNRFGLHSEKCISVFMTHQLRIKTNLPNWLETMVQKVNYRYINRFDACWVPDFANEKNVAGELAHPCSLPKKPIAYLGCLSRLQKKENVEKKYELMIVLSGPEPQRTMLENTMLAQLQDRKEKVLLVLGKPRAELPENKNTNLIIHAHLPANEMALAMQESEFIISRTGYTTVMDLLKLQCKSILIPTPGQTEQECLGQHLHAQKMALVFAQEAFDLTQAIDDARSFDYQFPFASVDFEQYKIVIQQFLESLHLQKR